MSFPVAASVDQQSAPASQTAKPFITVIGSSNFTRRSHTLDLESNAIILTKDTSLQEKMAHEMSRLTENTTREMKENDFLAEDRKVGWGVRFGLSVLGRML